jgi:hypothetical protein
MNSLNKANSPDKGLKQPSMRDTITNPIFLAPLLERPDLDKFEPVPMTRERHESRDPGKEWHQAIDALQGKTVGLSDPVVETREVPIYEWQDLRNIALFRFHCCIRPLVELMKVPRRTAVPVSLGGNAGWVIEEGGTETKSEANEFPSEPTNGSFEDALKPI